MMYTITPVRVIALLALYAALFFIIRFFSKPALGPADRKTFYTIGTLWAVIMLIGNYLLYRAGVMSFPPWLNNFLHTFLWIGVCLSYLYLAVREDQPMVVQCIPFVLFSLTVKYAEQMLFGTWELDHFFHVFRGNTAYVVGWSLVDGLYPLITLYGLRLLGRWVPGLIVL
jgi:hypothetical protein